jgi:5-methylcytosine-specific restriction protein A
VRARKVCSQPGCPNFQPCPAHQRKPWGASRRSDLVTLSGSKQQKRSRHIILRDDGRCHVCGEHGANEADHVIALSEGGADTLDNMAAIHSEPCHREKTAAEARRARIGPPGGTP